MPCIDVNVARPQRTRVLEDERKGGWTAERVRRSIRRGGRQQICGNRNERREAPLRMMFECGFSRTLVSRRRGNAELRFWRVEAANQPELRLRGRGGDALAGANERRDDDQREDDDAERDIARTCVRSTHDHSWYIRTSTVAPLRAARNGRASSSRRTASNVSSMLRTKLLSRGYGVIDSPRR